MDPRAGPAVPIYGGHVDRASYLRACDLLYTGPSGTPSVTGPDRQELQRIKHANDKKQMGPNSYFGPQNHSNEAMEFMKKFG